MAVEDKACMFLGKRKYTPLGNRLGFYFGIKNRRFSVSRLWTILGSFFCVEINPSLFSSYFYHMNLLIFFFFFLISLSMKKLTKERSTYKASEFDVGER